MKNFDGNIYKNINRSVYVIYVIILELNFGILKIADKILRITKYPLFYPCFKQ